MNTVEEKWPEIIERVKNDNLLTEVSYNTWLRPLKVYDVTDSVITLMIPSDKEPAVNIISKKYKMLLEVAIEELLDKKYEVSFLLEKDAQKDSRISQAQVSASNDIAKERFGLNPKYTFDTFVVGKNNSFAHAAALAVAESPGEAYNPLFLYGGVGLGKTHLMHSIAHYILDANPNAKILYVTSEVFTNELIDSIRNKANTTAMNRFREKYRNIDVLLVDDIQFIIGKEATQEEFFHTFNTLYEGKKQIVLTSDRPPKEIKTLEERLRTRFEWGLIADIQPPDIETRIAILNRKAKDLGVDLSPEVADYIAQRLKKNIRQLEGAIKKLKALLILDHVEINIAAAQNAIRDVLSDNVTVPVLIDRVLSEVSSYFGLTAEDLCSKKRTAEIAMARQIAMYAIREMAAVSLTQIGDVFGGRDHTTVMHSIHKVEDEMKVNPHLKSDVDEIMANIKAAGEY